MYENDVIVHMAKWLMCCFINNQPFVCNMHKPYIETVHYLNCKVNCYLYLNVLFMFEKEQY